VLPTPADAGSGKPKRSVLGVSFDEYDNRLRAACALGWALKGAMDAAYRWGPIPDWACTPEAIAWIDRMYLLLTTTQNMEH
jgi:hypothetical protein